jgi:chloramphenicol-sensitive protein RarD
LVYIWATNNGHVVETALGYYINPLIIITFGVVMLREKMRKLQWTAVGFGALGVIVLTIDYGRLPWIALALAVSWGSYGLVKKQLNLGALEGLAIETLLSPIDLLQQLLQIELDAGRERTEKYGPRTIDIDILFYNNSIIALPELDIPHPKIAERRFVLVPMVEIAADFLHPILKVTMSTLLDNCTDPLTVHKKTYSI